MLMYAHTHTSVHLTCYYILPFMTAPVQESIMWAAGKYLHRNILMVQKPIEKEQEVDWTDYTIDDVPDYKRSVLFMNEYGMAMDTEADPVMDWHPTCRREVCSALTRFF